MHAASESVAGRRSFETRSCEEMTRAFQGASTTQDVAYTPSSSRRISSLGLSNGFPRTASSESAARAGIPTFVVASGEKLWAASADGRGSEARDHSRFNDLRPRSAFVGRMHSAHGRTDLGRAL